MADAPETGVALSDDDLDALVQDAEGTSDETVTTDPDLDAPAPADEPADEAGEATETASPAAGDEDEISDPGTQAATPAPSPAIPTNAQPFRFKASGGMHTINGAYELPDGSIVVAKDSQADLRQRLASHVELATNFKQFQRDMRRQLNDAKAERSAKDVEADAVLNLLVDIRKMSPDERWEYLSEKFDNEMPKLELEIQKKKLELRQQELERKYNPQPTEEEVVEQRQQALTNELAATYHRLMKTTEIKELSADEVNAIFQKHAKRLDRLVSKNDKGEEIFDDQDVIDDINTMLDVVKRRAGSARQQNALRNADAPKNKIPPTVRPAAPASSTPAAKTKLRFANDRASFRDKFMKGDLDFD